MASAVDIANRALQKLGAKSIVSLTEDSKSAREMNRAYEPLRDALLQQHYWLFAKRRVVLSPSPTTPAFGFTYSYQLPSDFLRIVKGMDDENYEIEGRTLLTNQATSRNLVYISKVEDTNLMDPLFREALSGLLAFDLAESFTQSKNKKEAAWAMYEAAIKLAKKTGAMMRQAQGLPSTSWNNVRD